MQVTKFFLQYIYLSCYRQSPRRVTKTLYMSEKNPLYKKKLLLQKEEFSLTHGVPKAFISKRPFQRL